jgi:hypothetical protein
LIRVTWFIMRSFPRLAPDSQSTAVAYRFRASALCELRRTPTFPDVGRLCVMVPKKTEYWLRFSARLADGALGVRFELMARG